MKKEYSLENLARKLKHQKLDKQKLANTTKKKGLCGKKANKGVWGFVTVLVNKNNGNKWREWQRVDWMVCQSDLKYLPQTLLLANFLSLSNKESVIVSDVISFHASGKQGEIKAVPVLVRFPCLLVPFYKL